MLLPVSFLHLHGLCQARAETAREENRPVAAVVAADLGGLGPMAMRFCCGRREAEK